MPNCSHLSDAEAAESLPAVACRGAASDGRLRRAARRQLDPRRRSRRRDLATGGWRQHARRRVGQCRCRTNPGPVLDQFGSLMVVMHGHPSVVKREGQSHIGWSARSPDGSSSTSTSNAKGLLTCACGPKRPLTCADVSRRLSALGGVSRWRVPYMCHDATVSLGS